VPTVDELRQGGEIGGRTVQINASGDVECVSYEPSPLAPETVRIRTKLSAISPGTESTYLGRHASNVHVSKHWNDELRLFEPGAPSASHPIAFGYRAAAMPTSSVWRQLPQTRIPTGASGDDDSTTIPAAR
jgi:hypothetical protein